MASINSSLNIIKLCYTNNRQNINIGFMTGFERKTEKPPLLVFKRAKQHNVLNYYNAFYTVA